MHDIQKEKESRPANHPWFGWRDCLKPLSRFDTSANSVFPLTGRGVQRSGFEEESGFMMLIQGANS